MRVSGEAFLRRTKIVATLGPATDDPAVMAAMVRGGLDVARINFSHGGKDEQRRRILAQGHARTGDISKIAGYCGNSTVLENVLAEFAEAYAGQNARDHQALVTVIADGRVAASSQI